MKIDIERIIKTGKTGNKAIAVILIVLLLVTGALAIINISKSLYTTATEKGGLGADETKKILSDTLTILIVTSLIGALVLYLEGSPKFTSAIMLAGVVAVAKAVMIMDFVENGWLLYISLGILAVALAYTFKLLNQ